MSGWQADILMYHAISDAPGPTSIAPHVFAEQMRALADSGLPVVTPDALADPPAPRMVVITFDDGFADFADTAWPILRDHGFRPIVYLPSGRMGGTDSWAGGHVPPHPLMRWDQVLSLADQGVEFGAHSISHPDLTTLDAASARHEIEASGAEISARLHRPVRHFAAPYGASNAAIRRMIAKRYDSAVGTRLDVARSGDDIHDLPRLEMYYFTDIARWRAHLAGRGGPYLTVRKALRGLRARVRGKPW